MNRQIIPGILTDSLDDLVGKVEQAKGFCKRVIIDVIDGMFADNLTVMPSDMRDVGWGDLKADMQLMVEEPVDYLGKLHLLGVNRVFGHVERMGSLSEFGERCQELGLGLGWALDLHTPVDTIGEEELNETQGVLLMAVRAGFSGQKFDERVTAKIIELRKRGYDGDVVVDGGMNSVTIPRCLGVGANQFSVTSAIWKAEDPSLSYRELTDLLRS